MGIPSKKKSLGAFFLILWGVLTFWSAAFADDPADLSAVYQPLILRLSQEGYDPEFLSGLFLDGRAEFRPEVIKINLTVKETPDLYAKFLTPESILLARKFLRENIALLNEAERRFEVDKEVIVAILLVESRFGENIGKHRVVPTLASMALMDSPEHLQSNFLALQEIDDRVSYEWIEGVSKKRASWAYQELKSFLQIVRGDTVDPLEVRGSYAGAMGMAQFIPSSYLAYGITNQGLGSWLVGKEEAIFSIGNYLRSHGWRKSLSIEKKKKVVWHYNRSKPYVETILQVAPKIKP